MTNARTLPRAASYWTAAGVAGIALWTSGAPTTTYPLYDAAWHLSPAVTTTVFAVYPLTLVTVLLVFGDLADHIGRRATILLGLAAMLLGALLFALAPDIAVVFIGRVFMGIGVGLSLSPASAAVLEFSRPGRERTAGSVTTAATAVGLAIATVVGGALIQHAAWPLHLDFWVLAIAIAVLGVVAWFLPRHGRDEARGRWRPRGVVVARGIRRIYLVATLAISLVYMFGAMFLSLGAQMIEQLTGTHDLFVVGGILGCQAIVIGVVALATRSLPPRLTITTGAFGVLVAFAVLLEAAGSASLPLFLVATLVGGAAYSLGFSGGLGLIGRNAPAHHRAGTISATYLVSYLLQGTAAIVLGQIATDAGLQAALGFGAIGIGAYALATLLIAALVRPRGQDESTDAQSRAAARTCPGISATEE